MRMDARVLAFTAGVAVLAAIVAGLRPRSRRRAPNLVNELKSESRRRRRAAAAGRCATDWSATQIAVTMVLLVAAGLLTRSLLRRSTSSVGFDTGGSRSSRPS